MPKRIAPLSDIQIKNARPKEKEYKFMDGYGLFLLVIPRRRLQGGENYEKWHGQSFSTFGI